MIEAELKARVRDVDSLRAALSARADGEDCTYADTYYELPVDRSSDDGRELRVRTITSGSQRQALLTYKEPTVDVESGSKPEHETQVSDAEVVDTVLSALGSTILVKLEKHCTNYRFVANGRDMLATLVTVPELDGTFVELETLVPEQDTVAALADIRATLRELGIADTDLTTEQYTDAVLRVRRLG